jgi:hypothetical protein
VVGVPVGVAVGVPVGVASHRTRPCARAT